MSFKDFSKINLSLGGTGLSDRALLAKYLAVTQQSGLSILESLDIVGETARGKMKNIIAGVKKSVESGNSLADSLGRYPRVFSGIFTSAVYAGESSGTLAENVQNLSEQLKKEKELGAKVKGAMFYPLVVLVAAFILGMAMSFMVLPKITPLLEGLNTELPITTRGLIAFSHFVDQNGQFLFIGIVVGIIFLLWLVRQKFAKPVTHWLLLRVPIVKNIVRDSNLARFSRTLGTLLKSGLNIDEALSVTHNTLANYYFRRAVLATGDRVSKGATLAESLSEFHKLFPKMVGRMILVGEQSGKLEDSLLYLADFYEAEVDNSTKSLSTAIEPILLLFVGLIVGFLALSIITPIYNITGNIR